MNKRTWMVGILAVSMMGVITPGGAVRAGDDDDSGHGFKAVGAAPETLISRGRQISVAYRDKSGRPKVRKVRSMKDFSDLKATEDLLVTAETKGMRVAEWPVWDPSWSSTSTDPSSGNQWVIPNTSIDESWQYATGAATSANRVTVAVLDTGVNGGHADLSGQVLSGYNAQTQTAGPSSDPHGHGTHVAGIVAAKVANGLGVKGAAPGARILPVTVLDSSGSGTDADVANGIVWAVDHGADVINLSLGGAGAAPAMEPALQYARDHGVVVVCAAGNDGAGANDVFYPAAYSNVIAVGASTSGGALASYSQRQSYVDVTAPGSYILSTLNSGGYGYMSGTSMATPFVSGVVALLRSVRSLSPAAVQSVLEGTAGGSIGLGSGSGIVNPLAALKSLGVAPVNETTTTTVAETTTTTSTTLAEATTTTTQAPDTTIPDTTTTTTTTTAPTVAPPTTQPAVPTTYVALPRMRVIDTRYRRPVRVGTNTIRIVLDSRYRIPDNAVSVRVRIAVLRPSRTGYLFAYPAGTVRPKVASGRFAAYRYTYLTVDVVRGTGNAVDIYTTWPAYMAIDVLGVNMPVTG